MAEFKKIGAAWEKTDKTGQIFLSVQINMNGPDDKYNMIPVVKDGKLNCSMTRNKFKNADNQPDWIIKQIVPEGKEETKSFTPPPMRETPKQTTFEEFDIPQDDEYPF